MSLAGRLQLSPGQRVRLVNAPADFSLDADIARGPSAEAIVVFVRNRSQLAKHESDVLEQARADQLTWVAYPKAGQLGTDLNRDALREALEGKGVRPVRQVALDDTWSALRFRPG